MHRICFVSFVYLTFLRRIASVTSFWVVQRMFFNSGVEISGISLVVRLWIFHLSWKGKMNAHTEGNSFAVFGFSVWEIFKVIKLCMEIDRRGDKQTEWLSHYSHQSWHNLFVWRYLPEPKILISCVRWKNIKRGIEKRMNIQKFHFT